jgi:hypothetical protein
MVCTVNGDLLWESWGRMATSRIRTLSILIVVSLHAVISQEQFSIHLINSPPETAELQLLPLAGSQEYLDAKHARELEEMRYVDSSSSSEEGPFPQSCHSFQPVFNLYFFCSRKNSV